MGCVKMNQISFNKKSSQIKKTLMIPLVVVIMLAVATPMTFADQINVTFNPAGGIDVDVNHTKANFSSVTFNTQDNYPTGAGGDTSFIIYNNGSLAADVFIYANLTTNEGDMTLDDAGTPGVDEFSLDITGSNATQITSTNATWLNPLNAGGHGYFGLNLDLGLGSSDHDWQTTLINVTGAAN